MSMPLAQTVPQLGGAAPLIVYTAITADYDDLKYQPHASDNGATFVAFLDAPRASDTWLTVPAHRALAHPNRNAKIHKVLSHRYFPDAPYTLWIDGSVTIRAPQSLQPLIDTYLADSDIAVFRHRVRTCIYQEANVCMQRSLDDPELIWQQICRYTRAGFPANAGLAECPVILRRHTAAVRAFNEAWWEEISAGSRRDQISFNFVARRLGVRYAVLDGTIADNPWFHRVPHARPAEAGALQRADATAPEPEPAPRYFHSGASAARRKTIAFGRVFDQPSWSWAGFEVARELSKHYDVVLFDSDANPPPCDVLFLIKKRPTPRLIETLQPGTKLVYCPIDAYRSADELEADGGLLRACDAILVHSERLRPLLRAYCASVHFVEHHTRYALPELAPFKPDGFILWIGHCQYIPYLLHWLASHPLDHDVRLLTDLESERGRRAAARNAAQIGLPFELHGDSKRVAGCRLYRWSEYRQQLMMRECKAGLDVKHTELFSQYHKPPTKAQQFIASGIPCAVNSESSSAAYFRARGFELASPADPARWLSHEYWQETHEAAVRLRAETSIESVVETYRRLIESL
jgi:hypothetical protein